MIIVVLKMGWQLCSHEMHWLTAGRLLCHLVFELLNDLSCMILIFYGTEKSHSDFSLHSQMHRYWVFTHFAHI